MAESPASYLGRVNHPGRTDHADVSADIVQGVGPVGELHPEGSRWARRFARHHHEWARRPLPFKGQRNLPPLPASNTAAAMAKSSSSLMSIASIFETGTR